MPDTSSNQDLTLGVIGLGAMGFGTAASAVNAGIATHGFDLRAPVLADFEKAGGVPAESPAALAKACDAVLLMVVNDAQQEDVLFGEGGVADALAEGALVIGCVTVPPSYARDVAARIAERGLLYLDAPVSGGAVKAAAGELTVIASGSKEAFAAAEPVLDAVAEKVYRLGAEPGQASTMKMINQLLAGVHVATAMESMALAIKAGLDPETVYEVITHAAGNSWMFENRVPHVLENDYSPRSAVDIFVKDLGIVLKAGGELGMPLPMSAAAHQQYMAARGMGLARDDDASLIKVYQALSGFELPSGGGKKDG